MSLKSIANGAGNKPFIKKQRNNKAALKGGFIIAGDGGIEPPTFLLERNVIPFN